MSETQSSTPEPNGRGPALSVGEAAAQLGVSVDTVRAHLRQGTLPGEKLGNRWVVHLFEGGPASPAASPSSELDRLLAETAAPAPPEERSPHPALRHVARRVGRLWRRASATLSRH